MTLRGCKCGVLNIVVKTMFWVVTGRLICPYHIAFFLLLQRVKVRFLVVSGYHGDETVGGDG